MIFVQECFQGTQRMVQKTKAVGKGNGTAAPFIYLSDVLRDYGAYMVPTEGNGQGTQTSHGDLDEASTDFGRFLAAKIESTDILLFDVHTLTLISGQEMGEVLKYLRNRRSIEPTDIGIESGRDYCLEAERTIQAITEINAPAPAHQLRNRKKAARNETSAKLTPNSGAARTAFEEEWVNDRELISVEAMQLKLGVARAIVEREKKYPSMLGARAAARKPVVEVPAGATVLKRSTDWSDYVHTANKFNSSGLPALSLGAAAADTSGSMQGLDEKHTEWQELLKSMYREDPEQSHTALCKKLAMRLNKDSTKKVSMSTIRRNTRDPGKRKAGGSKPNAF